MVPTNERIMTVREVAEVLNVSPETVRANGKKMFPELFRQGKITYFTENHVTAIKMEIQNHHNLQSSLEVRSSTTDLEMLLLAKRVAAWQDEKIKALQVENAKLTHKAAFADAVNYSKEGILVREFAKIIFEIMGIPVGEKRLYGWLRSEKIIMPKKTEPYQEYVDREYFRLKESIFFNNEGDPFVKVTPLITGKGQEFLLDRLKKSIAKKGGI